MPNEVLYPHPDKIDIDLLVFDPLNPRLPLKVREKANDAREILNWMLDDAGVIDLMRSIGVQDYFSGEGLLVVRSGNVETETYTVIEGNRRLAALKLLSYPELASEHTFHSRVEAAAAEAEYRPRQIPVMVYEKREDILSYLGYRHITGIKAWSALAKARYLHELAQHFPNLDDSERNKLLARNIGSSPSYVAKLLAGLNLYETVEQNDFYGIKGLDEDEVDFSLITTALGYSNIQEFLGLENVQDVEQPNVNSDNLRDFTGWLFDKNPNTGKSRLEDSRNLGKLNAIVGSKEALGYFQEKGFTIHEAVLFTDEPVQNYRNLIIDIRQKLQAAQETLSLVREFSPGDLEDLNELSNRIVNIRGAVREHLQTDTN